MLCVSVRNLRSTDTFFYWKKIIFMCERYLLFVVWANCTVHWPDHHELKVFPLNGQYAWTYKTVFQFVHGGWDLEARRSFFQFLSICANWKHLGHVECQISSMPGEEQATWTSATVPMGNMLVFVRERNIASRNWEEHRKWRAVGLDAAESLWFTWHCVLPMFPNEFLNGRHVMPWECILLVVRRRINTWLNLLLEREVTFINRSDRWNQMKSACSTSSSVFIEWYSDRNSKGKLVKEPICYTVTKLREQYRNIIYQHKKYHRDVSKLFNTMEG